MRPTRVRRLGLLAPALAATAGLLPLTATAPVASAAVATAPAPPPSGWTQPGDRRGGTLIFDGYDNKDLAREGLYGMVYHLKAVKDEATCTAVQGRWPKQDIDPFEQNADALAARTSPRQEQVFEPKGEVVTLVPGASRTVTSQRTDTETWEHSIKITVESGELSSLVAKISAEYGFRYEKQISLTEGEEDSVTNNTPNHNQDYAYGVYRDVYVTQERPWTGQWLAKGAKVFAGDDADAVARYVTVPAEGCYRTGYFATLSLPRSKGHGLVAETPRTPTAVCDASVKVDWAKVYRRNGDGDWVQVDGALPRGTCLHLTGLNDDGGSEASLYLNFQAQYVRGKCEFDIEGACEGELYITDADLTGDDIDPNELPGWGAGRTGVLTSGRMGLYSAPARTNMGILMRLRENNPDTIEIQRTDDSLKWALRIIKSFRPAHSCPYYDPNDTQVDVKGRLYTSGCDNNQGKPHAAPDQRWSLDYADHTDGEDTLYLRRGTMCVSAEPATNVTTDVASVVKCDRTDPKQKWTFTSPAA
ncbi:hypothetical protein ACIRU8_32940 [Streptomyces sp. NPDC101175]|uniref:hypothetical protein n=1 Tax=Streptomyces sp. NPDC101175 TaxID=3366123 RepID=UPI0038324A36